MKSVLMAVYSLQPHYSDRIADLLSMLRNYGWEPVVLTHGSAPDVSEDPVLQIPEDIDIISTGNHIISRMPAFIQSAAAFLGSLFPSGGQKLWEFISVRKAVRIVKNGGADLLYTVSPPIYTHHLGLRLKKKFPNLPWVADMSLIKTTARYNDKSLLTRIREAADFIVEPEPEIRAPELSELFERACRATAAKKLENT